MTTTVAALYVDKKGVYPSLPGVDCWTVERDARRYEGPHPVVAHPPCKHWGRLRHLAKVGCDSCEWTGQLPWFNGHVTGIDGDQCDGNEVSDRDCGPRAVEQVRKFGGVLEHPAGSKLWEHCDLPHPLRVYQETPHGWRAAGIDSTRTDDFGGFTIEVDQCEWGHVARKRTWLYLVGVPREALEAPPFPGRAPTHQVSRDAERAQRRGYTLKRTSTKANMLTPPPFAEYLSRVARAAAEARRAA